MIYRVNYSYQWTDKGETFSNSIDFKSIRALQNFMYVLFRDSKRNITALKTEIIQKENNNE